jgi:hypothetical protein
MTHASSPSWNACWNPGAVRHGCGGPPRRGLEIAGIVLAFIFFWPAALAYLVWKFMGYPVPNELKTFYEQNFSSAFASMRRAAPSFGFAGTGNAAFDDYRRRELERLEEERRRLDEEAKEFAAFVEELKRAKDREEFDAFMARRRDANEGTTSV